MAQIIYNPETGQYEIDYSDGQPYDGAPFNPMTGVQYADGQPYNKDELPPGVVPNDPWKDGVWNTGPVAPAAGATDPAAAPTAPVAPPSDSGGMPSISLGNMLSMPGLPGVGDAPTPNLPTFAKGPAYESGTPFSPTPWKAPTPNETTVDPSYQWRRDQSLQGLQRWAAAKGTLNDSGTANALTDYAGNAASQEYANIFNRAFTGWQGQNQLGLAAHQTNEAHRRGAYDTNYQSQHVDPYRYAYQSALDLHKPQMETWQAKNDNARLGYSTEAAWAQDRNRLSYQDYWNRQRNAIDLASL